MSSILDALRKSEHERQIASGQSVSMLYPVEIKPDSKPWLILTLLALTAIIIFALVLWMWSRPIAPAASNTIIKPAITPLLPPQAISNEALPEHVLINKPEKSMPVKVIPEYAHKRNPVPTHVDTRQKLADHVETMPSNAAVIDKAENTDPLKGLPELNITGYIHNEQTGNLAMINNQLVHEGEEISPGLRLVKILEDKAVFSYKGYVFSR